MSNGCRVSVCVAETWKTHSGVCVLGQTRSVCSCQVRGGVGGAASGKVCVNGGWCLCAGADAVSARACHLSGEWVCWNSAWREWARDGACGIMGGGER